MATVTGDVALETGSDAALIALVRDGDEVAFGRLYERHQSAARVVASQYAPRQADVDDLVAEAFTQIYRLLRQGDGPDAFFRAYLFTCIRNQASRGREAQGKVRPTDDEAVLDSLIDHPDANLEFFERELITEAFESLPERWRSVLWYLEVEGLRPADVTDHFGLTANGVAALAYRAREGLRQAYLQHHASSQLPEACQSTAEKLGAYTRDALAPRERGRVEAHLVDCKQCKSAVGELSDVNRSLRGVLGPLVFGAAASAALSSLTQAGLGALPPSPMPALELGAAAKPAASQPWTWKSLGSSLTRPFRFSTHPVMATLSTLGSVVVIASLVIGLLPLFHVAPWQNSAPKPASFADGPPAISTEAESMTTLFMADGHLAAATAGAPFAVPKQGGTVNSQAALSIPAGATVRRAELVWACNDPAENWWKVSLTDPTGSKHSVLAERRVIMPSGVQLGADVTDAVTSGGAGLWRIGDLVLAEPQGQGWAGWALSVVYSDPALPQTRVSILEGSLRLGTEDGTSQAVSAPAGELAWMAAVVWGGSSADLTTAWLIDNASTPDLGQGYPVEAVIDGQPTGIQLLLGEHAYFPQGPGSAPGTSISFRSAPDSTFDRAVGLLTVVAPNQR